MRIHKNANNALKNVKVVVLMELINVFHAEVFLF